jgi:hypothetical protein
MSEHRMYADAFAVKDPKRHAAIDRKKVIRQHADEYVKKKTTTIVQRHRSCCWSRAKKNHFDLGRTSPVQP